MLVSMEMRRSRLHNILISHSEDLRRHSSLTGAGCGQTKFEAILPWMNDLAPKVTPNGVRSPVPTCGGQEE